MGSGNWIVDNLNSALQTWNDKLAEIWTLISTTPEDFKGGGIWNVIVSINGALQAIGYALLVLFFVMGVVKTCGSFTDVNFCYLQGQRLKESTAGGLDYRRKHP